MTNPVGLGPGDRYRCTVCGNLTRFDVEVTERTRRFWHSDLAGSGEVADEERVELRVESVTCRWCGPASAVEVVAVPGRLAVTGGSRGSGRDG